MIVSASTFFLNARSHDQSSAPSSAYQRVICRLRERQNLSPQDKIGKQCVLLSLLLLATVIVNGSSDFRTIIRLLDAAVAVTEDNNVLGLDELGQFLATQIEK